MKKAVSPLLSWILTVVIVISVGTFISYWATNYVKKICIGCDSNEDLYCDNVNIKTKNICRSDLSTLLVDVSNTGSFNLTTLTIYRRTENTPPESCLMILNDNHKPGSIKEYNFFIDALIDREILSECPLDRGQIPAEPTLVNEMSIIPWITVDDKEIPCNEKKIMIDNVASNVLCDEFRVDPDVILGYPYDTATFTTNCVGNHAFSIEVTNTGPFKATAVPDVQLNAYDPSDPSHLPMNLPVMNVDPKTYTIDSINDPTNKKTFTVSFGDLPGSSFTYNITIFVPYGNTLTYDPFTCI